MDQATLVDGNLESPISLLFNNVAHSLIFTTRKRMLTSSRDVARASACSVGFSRHLGFASYFTTIAPCGRGSVRAAHQNTSVYAARTFRKVRGGQLSFSFT